MKYIKNILNFIIKFSFLFIFFGAWCGMYSKNLALNISISVLCTLIIMYILKFFKDKKLKRNNLKKSEQEEVDKNYENFLFLPIKEQKKLIADIMQKNLIDTKVNGAFIDLTTESIKKDKFYNIVQYAQSEKLKKIYVFCKSSEPSLQIECERQANIEITICNKEKIYSMCKQCETFAPQTINFTKKSKTNFKMFFSILLNKNRAKQYVSFSVFLLLFSFLTLFKTYYIIASSFFLLLAILSFIFSNREPKQNKIN